jgi:hypothetical protein
MQACIYHLGVFFALSTAVVYAQTADYSTNVHVSSARYVLMEEPVSRDGTFEELSVVIDGQKLQLAVEADRNGLLATGDYKAKLIKDEHKTSYESSKTYEILFPDGRKMKFDVVGQSE